MTKKKKTEVLEVWTNLKEKLIPLLKEFGIENDRTVPDSLNTKNRIVIAENKLDRAERKLEKVRDLVSQEQFSKLKQLIKKGQI